MLTETVELGTDRVIRWTLLEDGATVQANTVTRAQFNIAGQCFDSDVDTEIALEENATEVVLKLGDMNVAPGFYMGYLTITDASSELPWLKARIRFVEWPKC